MPDLEIIFKTRAELAGAKATMEALERQIGQLKILGKDASAAEAQLQRMQTAMAAAGKPSGPGMGEAFGKLREELGNIIPGFAKVDGLLSKFAGGSLAAVGAGFAALAGGIETAREALNEYAQQEEQVAKLDAALAQAALLTDDYRERLQALAGQFQETTGVADEKWLAVLTRLTQFGASPENIEQYAEAVKNLAGLLGGDVETAANVFSRALQGNFEMFSRYGIHVDEAGTKTERLGKLMEELAQRGGGQLEAAANSLTGQWRQFANATADVSKGIGRLIAETGLVQGVLSIVTDSFSWLSEVLSGVVPKVDGLENAIRPTISTMDEAGESAKRYATGLEQVAKDGTAAATAVDEAIRKIRELQQLQDEKDSAEMALQLAQVTESETSHKISGSEAIQKRADIRKEFDRKKFERGQEALKQEMQQNKQAYLGKGEEVDEAYAAVEKRKEQLKLQAEIEHVQAIIRSRQESSAKAEQDYSKAQEERDKNSPAGERNQLLPGTLVPLEAFTKEGKLNLPNPFPSAEEFRDMEAGRTPEGEKVKETNALLAAELKLLDDAKKKLADLQEVQQANGGATTLTAAQLEQEVKAYEALLKKKEDELEALAPRIKGNEVLQRRSSANEEIYPTKTKTEDINTRSEVGKAQDAERREMERQAEEHERKLQQQQREEQRQLEHELQMRKKGFQGGDAGGQADDVAQNSDAALRELEKLTTVSAEAFGAFTDALQDVNAQLVQMSRQVNTLKGRVAGLSDYV